VELDVLECPKCGERMSVIAIIDQPDGKARLVLRGVQEPTT